MAALACLVLFASAVALGAAAGGAHGGRGPGRRAEVALSASGGVDARPAAERSAEPAAPASLLRREAATGGGKEGLSPETLPEFDAEKVRRIKPGGVKVMEAGNLTAVVNDYLPTVPPKPWEVTGMVLPLDPPPLPPIYPGGEKPVEVAAPVRHVPIPLIGDPLGNVADLILPARPGGDMLNPELTGFDRQVIAAAAEASEFEARREARAKARRQRRIFCEKNPQECEEPPESDESEETWGTKKKMAKKALCATGVLLVSILVPVGVCCMCCQGYYMKLRMRIKNRGWVDGMTEPLADSDSDDAAAAEVAK